MYAALADVARRVPTLFFPNLIIISLSQSSRKGCRRLCSVTVLCVNTDRRSSIVYHLASTRQTAVSILAGILIPS